MRKTKEETQGDSLSSPSPASIIRQIADGIEDPCFAIDGKKEVIAWNGAMEILTGAPAAEILGKSDLEYAMPFYGSKRPMLIDMAVSQDSTAEEGIHGVSREDDLLKASESFPGISGENRVFNTRARAIRDAKACIIGAVQIFQDAAKHRFVQQDESKSDEKYRTFFENATDFFYIHDFQGNMIETNLVSKMYTSYTVEDLARMNIKDIMPDSYKAVFDGYIARTLEEGKGEGIISILNKDGHERVIEYRNIVVRDSHGNPLHVQGSGRDITESIKAQRALKLSEERYRNILDSIEEGYFEVDLTGNFTFFNQALSRNLKYTDEEVKGMNYRQYMDESNARKVFDVFHKVFITGETTKAFDWELMDKFGNKLYVEASVSTLKDSKGKIVGFRGMVRDITERKEAEKERDRYELRLAQAQKLEAIGTLAGGIAHDFNNMLSAIMGYTELARKDLPGGTRPDECLAQVLKAGMRAKDLIAQILTFSRKFEAEREPVNTGLILNEAINLLRATIPTSIRIACTSGHSPLFVFADPTELHQIIMNLCTNAYQAMEDKGGKLRILLESVVVDDAEIGAIDQHLSPGPYVKLSVSDTGCGMDEDTMKNIFDPFFTTKKRGKGTGLGLATVHRIVTELKGSISVQSAPEKGATFILHLPRFTG